MHTAVLLATRRRHSRALLTACRQGMGVTGGTPMGFDVGASGPGGTLKGLDLVRQNACAWSHPALRPGATEPHCAGLSTL